MALTPNFSAVDVRGLRDITLNACEAGTLGVTSDLFNFFKTELDTQIENHATDNAIVDAQLETVIPETLNLEANSLVIAMNCADRHFTWRGFVVDPYVSDDQTSVMWVVQWGAN